jgi:hypothetical protein
MPKDTNTHTIPRQKDTKHDWHAICYISQKPKKEVRMTDKLKEWLENGENAAIGAKLIAESLEGNYLLKTKSAVIVFHPRFGHLAVTKYGALFNVPANIERISTLGDQLYAHTKAGLIFVYDLQTGQLIEIAEE